MADLPAPPMNIRNNAVGIAQAVSGLLYTLLSCSTKLASIDKSKLKVLT